MANTISTANTDQMDVPVPRIYGYRGERNKGQSEEDTRPGR